MNGDLAAKLQREFTFFATMCEGVAPLYAALSAQVAQEPWVRALSVPQLSGHQDSRTSGLQNSTIAAPTRERNPPANMLFGAVQYLLLGGVDHPLSDYYPSIVGAEHAKPATDAWPVFVEFCRAHEDDILRIVAIKRVQTNEVGRCGVLLPGFEQAKREFRRSNSGGRDARTPLHLIELGASAGLNLLFDRYRYEYSNGVACGGRDDGTASADSPVVIRTAIRGEHAPPIPSTPPRIVGRVGVDLAPVDVTDAEQMRWVQALIWADDVDRHAQLRAAVQLAQHDPPRIIRGDGLHHLPRLIHAAPAAALPVVFHSHAIYQMPHPWRDDFAATLNTCGRDRDFTHLSLEWLGDDPGPMLHLTTWRNGVRTHHHLARAHHHGRWIEWTAQG